jgi:RNA polymerase sigma-70 factor, ECF subfamily
MGITRRQGRQPNGATAPWTPISSRWSLNLAKDFTISRISSTSAVSVHENDDRGLIARAQAGDATAFQQVAQEHAAPLWRCALALGKDRQWAEDLVQETLIEAWRSLKRFDGRCRLSTWLYGILRHRFLKGRRRHTAYLPNAGHCEQSSTEWLPDRNAEFAEDAELVRRAVASLPEEHRVVVELRFFAGASLEDIAAAVECPLGTVKSRLHHALEKLRRMKLTVNLLVPSREIQENER